MLYIYLSFYLSIFLYIHKYAYICVCICIYMYADTCFVLPRTNQWLGLTSREQLMSPKCSKHQLMNFAKMLVAW